MVERCPYDGQPLAVITRYWNAPTEYRHVDGTEHKDLVAAMTRSWEIDVPMIPNKRGEMVPPLNANYRLHWRVKHERTSGIRSVVAWRVREAKIPPQSHVTVRLHFHAGDNRRRDASNLYATSKPAIDGLVDAGVVPDDDGRYVTEINPLLHPPDPDKPRRLWLTITPTEDE